MVGSEPGKTNSSAIALGSENSVENAPLRSSLSLGGIGSSLGMATAAPRILTMLLQRRSFLRNADTSCPHEGLEQWNVAVSLRHGIGIHTTVVDPSHLTILGIQGRSNDLDLNSCATVCSTAGRLAMEVVVQSLRVTDGQNLRQGLLCVRPCSDEEASMTSPRTPVDNVKRGIREFLEESSYPFDLSQCFRHGLSFGC